ncbi:isoniazid-induced protein IniA-like [Saccostrea cucullata]|uniref:isoniazid-induced protein IniA-like n=1 Tax=Saccostrea cuccullata TaxID=36930 RepID=UPI002ED1D027
MKRELENAVPEYMSELEKRMEDLERLDCGITITGDTSSGKTSLVNKLLGQRVTKPRLRAATSTICRYHNSDEMALQIVNKSGEVSTKEIFTKTADLRSRLEATSHVKKRNTTDIKYVDVFFPIPILQGNLMFVDTPGIGATEELTSKLIDYLSESISFIFLIDVSHDGGVAKDRLQIILSKVIEKCDLMPCFEP